MKTFLLASCAALFAGGLIYFGSDIAENGGSAAIETVEASGAKDIMSRYIGSDEIDPEVTEEAENDNPYEVETGKDHPHPPNKSDEKDDGKNIEIPPEPELDVIEAEVDVKTESAPFEIEVEVESSEPELRPEQVEEMIIKSIESQIQGDGSETVLVEVGIIETEMEPNIELGPDQGEKADDSVQTRIDAVFEQTEKISQPDLQDRAYLDLVDFATKFGRFEDAKEAALKIQQIELRDTARSRIADGLARNGQVEEAFALIEDVEIDELRDVLRLQAIEALLDTDDRR